MYKTVAETLVKTGQQCSIVKKGKRYLCFRSGELALTTDRQKAVAFKNEKEAVNLLNNAIVDDRNAKVIGRGCGIVVLTKG